MDIATPVCPLILRPALAVRCTKYILEIDNNWRLIDENCLKTQILLFLIIFVAIADGVFLYKKKPFSPLFFIAVVVINAFERMWDKNLRDN